MARPGALDKLPPVNFMGFVPLRSGPAVCDSGGTRRSCAGRIWVAHLAPSAKILGSAPALCDRCPTTPGRVHGLGEFEDPDVHAAISARLPPGHALHLRRRFEWYACRGAGFHTDAHYADVLFGAWCVAGPRREIVFSRAGLRVGGAVGDLAIFDPFEPHAVLDPGQRHYSRDYFTGAEPSLFVGFEIALDQAAREAFGIDEPLPSGPVLCSAVAVNAETGALP